ncbi:MAG: hypothetical protein RR573_07950 [Oscillospiraceae bacterium]
MAKKEPNPLRRRRRIRQIIGAVVCLLVVIGIVGVVDSTINVVTKLTDNSTEKQAYEARLSNLVAYDPLPFDTLAEANQNMLLAAAIWGTLGENDQSVYERDDIGQLYLPTVDVDRFAAKLYGTTFKFTHSSFEDHGLNYEYITEKEAYIIPITGALSEYFPKVEKIKNEHGTKRVTVGYLSYGAGVEFNVSATLEPSKYVDYIFTKSGKDYYLSAIEESKMKATVSSSSNTSSQPILPEDFVDQNKADSLLPSVSASMATAVSTSEAAAE